ncbi:MAG: energy transducer TonB [Ignavibacteriaceae bacterium]
MPIFKAPKADLKSKYKIYFEVSIIITLLLLIAAFKFVPKSSETKKFIDQQPEIISVENIQSTNQNTIPPKMPKPIQPVISYADDIEDIEFQTVEINYDKNLNQPPPKKDKKKIEDEPAIICIFPEMPEIIGGLAAIQNKIHYTELARKAGIEGKIIVKAVIDEEGKVINAEVVRGLIPQLDEMALNAVKTTLFKPGRQRGKPIKVQMSIPITFKLR